MSALVLCGLYFTCSLRFMQFLGIGEMLRVLFSPPSGSKLEKRKKISSFQAFAISAAARVGTGNIAGVAIAITTGGPGAVFWMWAIAVVGAASAFAEAILAQAYKVRNGTMFRGGPAYYIKNGLKMPRLAMAFAIIITLTFSLVFNSVQSNTIASAFTGALSPSVSGVILTALTGAVIFGGLRRIAHFSALTVPFFAISYILVTIIVICMNVEKLPSVFNVIFTDAFSPRNMVGGALGATIMTGARRGLFSNEAGMGSAPNAAATADVIHPAIQGYVQAFGVFFDTLIICSCTAFMVLITDYQSFNSTGIMLTKAALSAPLGKFGSVFITFSLFLFAFTSIIGNYYYGQSNIEFITKNRKVMFMFRCLVLFMVLFGAMVKLNLVWNMADLFMSVMALINIFAIFKLRGQAKELFLDYQKFLSKNIR